MKSSNGVNFLEKLCHENLKFKKAKSRIRIFRPILGGTRLLRVLHRQAHGTARHGLLRAAKEGQSSVVLALVPSHGHADDLVGLHKVLPGGSWHVHRRHKLVRAHRDVLLLHARGYGT